MPDTNAALIAEVRLLLADVTPGPWRLDFNCDGAWSVVDDSPRQMVIAARHEFPEHARDFAANADLIAHAPTWLRDLADRLEAAEAWGQPSLARHQPCGCIVCQCGDVERCHGCGTKKCGTHGGPIPNPVYEPHPLVAERDALKDRLEAAERERDLAIAHDRQPYPTAEAYERVCEALRQREADAAALREALNALVDAINERCDGDDPDRNVYLEALEAELIAARRAVAVEGAVPRQSCEWTEDADGIWQTDCGQEFTFIDAGPTENQMKFCAYCGKALRPVTYKEDIEAAEPQPSAPAERGGEVK